jgi:hypothetical protein
MYTHQKSVSLTHTSVSDKTNNLVVFDIEAYRKPKPQQIPWFPRAVNCEESFARTSTTKGRQREHSYSIRLVQRQTILREVVDLNRIDVSELHRRHFVIPDVYGRCRPYMFWTSLPSQW